MLKPDTARGADSDGAPSKARAAALLEGAEALAADLAAEALRAVAKVDRGCTEAAISKRWGCNHSYVARLFAPTSGVNITLAKVLALPRPLARDILVRALAALDGDDGAPPSPRETADRIAIELGRAIAGLHDELADDAGAPAHARHAGAFARIAALALRGQAAAARGPR